MERRIKLGIGGKGMTAGKNYADTINKTAAGTSKEGTKLQHKTETQYMGK